MEKDIQRGRISKKRPRPVDDSSGILDLNRPLSPESDPTDLLTNWER